ncbi:MAG: Phosphate regulon transcriptional regulatory protein PhoB [bacterium]|nr:Phosphate regulon transcriptional regulatory protein PhoB [bacterium]
MIVAPAQRPATLLARKNILVVEDEEDILELVEYNLAKNGFRVSAVSSGEAALRAIQSDPPDLVLLDLMLPGVDGLEVCKLLKSDSRTAKIPVVMLTAKGEESDIITGLELGADDYIAKPFSPKVLIARVRTVLRRRTADAPEEGSIIRIHDLYIHPGRHEVLVADRPVELTFTEFRILHLLARRPGWVFTRSQIVDSVRGVDYPVTDRAVDVHIVGLRKKLGQSGGYIETVRGVGYRLKE